MNDNNRGVAYGLTLFEREAAAYSGATEHYLRTLHQIFSHTTSLLRGGDLLKPQDDQGAMSIDIRLPWSYTLGVEFNGPGSTRYWVWSRSWSGRAKEFVSSTAIYRNGEFDYSFSQEDLSEFDRCLRFGFLDRVAEYASRDKSGRAEILGQRRPSEDDKVEEEGENWDDLEGYDETADVA